MKIYKTHIALLLLFVAFVMIAACSSNECLDNKNSLPLAGFYSSDVNPQSIAIDSLSIYGIDAPGDSILLDSVVNVSSAYLPFRIDQTSTSYVIHYNQKTISNERYNDTITFDYEIIPYFVSSACGSIYKYKMNSIDHSSHFIDSVVCTAPLGVIDNVAVENLRIYFRIESGEAAEK